MRYFSVHRDTRTARAAIVNRGQPSPARVLKKLYVKNIVRNTDSTVDYTVIYDKSQAIYLPNGDIARL